MLSSNPQTELSHSPPYLCPHGTGSCGGGGSMASSVHLSRANSIESSVEGKAEVNFLIGPSK